MIKNNQALSMSEAAKYINADENADSELKGMVKKLVTLKPEKAEEMREKIVALELMKVRDEHISKMIDLLPETSEELNKIFVDTSLDEDETNKLLSTVKDFK